MADGGAQPARPDTPAVMIDLQIVRRNIARIQKRLDALGLKNRPHIKTHKLCRLAQMQVGAGAVGIACQKIGEAEIMADAGIADILIPYNIVGEAKLRRLVALARRCTVSVSADSRETVAGLAGAFAREPEPLAVLVECDTGHGRCGVQSAEQALALAIVIDAAPGLRFAGLMTYPPMRDMADVNAWLRAARDMIAARGLACAVISTGGTPNLGQTDRLTVATEHRPGTYIYNDRSLLAANACELADCALTVRSTVISRPTETRAIIDAGSKVLTSDLLGLDGYGLILGAPEAKIAALSEEHGHVELRPGGWQPAIGEVVSIVPNHACVVSNVVGRVHLVDGGRIETVDVDARGAVV